jgi:transposase InsO family protein
MVRRGLIGRCKRRFKITTTPDPDATSLAPDLLKRNFSPQAHELDTAWCGDITYIRTWEGWLYLATVIDLASRRVVGFAMADHMRADLVCDALEMAIEARRPAPGLIFHTDRGSQYTSERFAGLLRQHSVVQSLSRPRQCWDNAVAESWFATLKEELIYRQGWPTRTMARRAIFEFIEVFYNRQRLHSSLGNLTPVAYEEGRRKSSAHSNTQAA